QGDVIRARANLGQPVLAVRIAHAVPPAFPGTHPLCAHLDPGRRLPGRTVNDPAADDASRDEVDRRRLAEGPIFQIDDHLRVAQAGEPVIVHVETNAGALRQTGEGRDAVRVRAAGKAAGQLG